MQIFNLKIILDNFTSVIIVVTWLCFYLLSLFKYVLFVARAFSHFLFERADITVLYSADVGRILYINGYYFIFLAYTNVCSVTELT